MKPTAKIRPKVSRPSGSPVPQSLIHPAMLDTLPIGVVRLDSRLRILSVNVEAARLLGQSADCCLSKLLHEVLSQQSRTSSRNIVTRIQGSLPDRRPIQAAHTMLVDPAYEVHPVEWSYVPLDAGEDYGGVLSAARPDSRERAAARERSPGACGRRKSVAHYRDGLRRESRLRESRDDAAAAEVWLCGRRISRRVPR